MNNERILRVANIFLLLSGYQLQIFSAKDRRYRLSLWGLINFTLLTLLYLICFNHHFEWSPVLYLLQELSPFLRGLVRLQLWLGLKTMLFGLYEAKWITRSADSMAEALPRLFARKFSREEGVAYVLLFLTFLTCLSFAFYIGYEMEFQLPPQDYIFIFVSLLVPHFVLAGALRFFLVGSWLMRQEVQALENDLEVLFEDKQMQGVESVEAGAQNAAIDVEPHVRHIYNQLELLATTQKRFTQALRRQLLLLIILNSNCLLAGVYIKVFFESAFFDMFEARMRRVLYAANWGIFVFITLDYLCLCYMEDSYDKVKQSFDKKLVRVLRKGSSLSKNSNFLLRDTQHLLLREFNFYLIGTIKMNCYNFILLQVAIVLVIFLVVNYLYFKSEIAGLNVSVYEMSVKNDD